MLRLKRNCVGDLWRHDECVCHRSPLIGRGTSANQKEAVCHCQDVQVASHLHAAEMLVFPQDYNDYSITDGQLYLRSCNSESPSTRSKSTSATISASAPHRDSPLRTWPNKTLLFPPWHAAFPIYATNPQNWLRALYSWEIFVVDMNLALTSNSSRCAGLTLRSILLQRGREHYARLIE